MEVFKIELDPQACADYVRDYRNYEQGRKDEASYHTYTPLIPFWIKAFVVYSLVVIFAGALIIMLIKT